MTTELRQKNRTVWVTVGDNLVVVTGPLEDCEWYNSTRIVSTISLGDATILLLA